MKKTLIIICLISFSVNSQTLFEDESGDSSFYINQGPKGWIKFNSSSSSVTLGYNRNREVGYDFETESFTMNYLLSLNSTAVVEKGVGSVFSKEDIAPGVGGELHFGLISRDYFDKDRTDENKFTNSIASLFFKIGMDNKKLTTIDTLNISKTSKNKWLFDFSLNLNLKINNPRTVDGKKFVNYHFIGTSIGRKKISNLETLGDVQLQTISGSSETSQVVKVDKGKAGQLDLATASYLYIDYGFMPTLFGDNQIGFNGYYRGNYGGFKTVNNLGFGVFFSKKDVPEGILGGVAFQLNDINNNLEKEENLLQRSTIFFYVGYNLY